MKITLNIAEQKLAMYIAKARYDNNRAKGNPDTKLSSQSNKEIELDGISGELVVCRMLNVYPDTGTDDIVPPKYDLMSANGSKVDVKTTKYASGRLLATKNKKLGDCDIYVLVTGIFPTYKIVGWCRDDELLKKENLIDLGRGEGYALTQDKLRAFSC